jgi:hypothetical protein
MTEESHGLETRAAANAIFATRIIRGAAVAILAAAAVMITLKPAAADDNGEHRGWYGGGDEQGDDQGGWNGGRGVYVYGGSTYYAPPPPVYYAPPPTYYYDTAATGLLRTSVIWPTGHHALPRKLSWATPLEIIAAIGNWNAARDLRTPFPLWPRPYQPNHAVSIVRV